MLVKGRMRICVDLQLRASVQAYLPKCFAVLFILYFRTIMLLCMALIWNTEKFALQP